MEFRTSLIETSNTDADSKYSEHNANELKQRTQQGDNNILQGPQTLGRNG